MHLFMKSWRTLKRYARFGPQDQLNNLLLRASRPVILARWSSTPETRRNWGDAANAYLIERLSGLTPLNIKQGWVPRAGLPVYSVIGSVLDKVNTSNLIVWGSGFMHEGGRPRTAPREVLAVRGPLSRANLISAGLACPPLYGDPAIIMPRLYTPNASPKRHSLGIIPHYVHATGAILAKSRNGSDILMIDVRSGLHEFIDQIATCEAIASSSLHGIIAAHAYGIPATWVRLGGRIGGGEFKFRDYFLSVGIKASPVDVRDHFDVPELIARASLPKLNLVDDLIAACPFLHPGAFAG